MLEPVLRKLGLVFAALSLFSIAGGHWAALQTIAWAEMLRAYTLKSGSVTAAVEQTFDGAHPCAICLKIAAGKQREARGQSDKQGSPQKVVKAEKNDKALPLETILPGEMAPARLRWHALSLLNGPGREDQPPTPPPRRGAFAA